MALINAAMDGPVVMTGNWQSRVGFDVSTATVYRGGNPSSLNALQPNDVIYQRGVAQLGGRGMPTPCPTWVPLKREIPDLPGGGEGVAQHQQIGLALLGFGGEQVIEEVHG